MEILNKIMHYVKKLISKQVDSVEEITENVKEIHYEQDLNEFIAERI